MRSGERSDARSAAYHALNLMSGGSTAVLVDATVVRMVLVPAVMQLLGDRIWWLPRWRDRLIPRPELEPSAA